LPNVWDAASARIVENAGFPAVATGSAGVAFCLGYRDGEVVPLPEMLGQVRRIARVVSVPVTADLEAGYEDVERTAEGLIEAGGVGLNLEDLQHGTLIPIPDQVRRIERIRVVGERLGVPLVINARTDIFLAGIGLPETRFAASLERLKAYRDAGADCLFVPGVRDDLTIRRFVEALQYPLNILAVQGAPSVERLEELGVARVSFGSGPMRATLGLMSRICAEIRDRGTYEAVIEGALSYDAANGLFR
jgi:2-methylisocitrate lyase-like PEP mutase family enzyme